VTTLVLPVPVYAVIIENGRVREIRPMTLEELAAWADFGNTQHYTEEVQKECSERFSRSSSPGSPHS